MLVQCNHACLKAAKEAMAQQMEEALGQRLMPKRWLSEPWSNKMGCFRLSADSPPQNGCHVFTVVYLDVNLMLCKVCLGHVTVESGGVEWG